MDEGVCEEDKITFRIPSLPASMNSIYQIIFHLRQVSMKPEVRAWKHQAKMMVPAWARSDETKFISVKMWFHGDWMYKNGKVRKIDLPNLEKVTIDAISEKQGWDDSMAWHKESWKIQDKQEFVDVELRSIKEIS